MPLPTLNTNYLTNGVDVQNTLYKAAAINAMRDKNSSSGMKNALTEQQYKNALLDYQSKKQSMKYKAEDRNIAAKDRDAERAVEEAGYHLDVSTAPSLEIAKRKAKAYNIDFHSDDWIGSEYSMTLSNGAKIKGPRKNVQKVLEFVVSNPSYMTDEKAPEGPGTKKDHLRYLMAKMGIELTPAEKKQYKPMTRSEQIKFEKDKAKARKGATGEDKPEMTATKARKELVWIEQARLRISSKGGMDDMLFAMIAENNPKMAEQLRGADKTGALKALDEYEAHVRKFVPESTSATPDMVFNPQTGKLERTK